MKTTLTELDNGLKGLYSGYSNVTVTTLERSFGVSSENIDQTTLTNVWNTNNPTKNLHGTCVLTALTMLFRKYMDINSFSNSYTNQQIFNILANYGWQAKYYSGPDDSDGLTDSEMKALANKFIKACEKGAYSANVDTIGLWSTMDTYFNDRVRPVIAVLKGSKANHAVLANCEYVERVSYTVKILGISHAKHADYKVLRICNGWADSYNPSRTAWDGSVTYQYVYFDCVKSILKLK